MAIGFAALGTARTTRQGRGRAMAIAIIAIVALRIAVFFISSLIVRSPLAVPLAYLVPIGVTVASGLIAFGGNWIGRLWSSLTERQGPLKAAAAS
jgi:lipopolysaccharide export system permease protein